MPITSLRFTNVGPFDDIEFEFDPQVNVFTGPNNSGKSTVLWVLGDIAVYPFGLPDKLVRSGKATWKGIALLADGQVQTFAGNLPTDLTEIEPLLDRIGYTSFVPALRSSTDFRSKGPSLQQDLDPRIEQEFQRMLQAGHPQLNRMSVEEIKERIRDGLKSESPNLQKRSSLLSCPPVLVSGEAVIQKIVDLDYRAHLRRQPAIGDLIGKVAAVASEITDGFPITFTGVRESDTGFYPEFRTMDGDVPLNVLSQGTQSIIQWLAHLLFGYAEYYDFPPNLEEQPGILIIDEIDAHLHPSWQRRIIPTLIKYFPNLQIFCSTHSPLMLAGLKAGQVQLLRRDEKGKVTVSRNEQDIIGWSADEILRTFLDVPSPTDLGTVRHLERLQELERKENLSAEEAQELEQLRHAVNRDLLSGRVAAQVDRLAELFRQSRGKPAATSGPTSLTATRAPRRRTKPAG